MVNNGKANGFKGNLQVVENLEAGGQKIYNSVFVDPKYIDIIRNDLAMQIVGKLAGAKSCAMDLSRELKQHEQKIYYHIRRLEKAGIIKKAGVERRFGMLAKMYTAVSPIVSAKLYEDGRLVSKGQSGLDLIVSQLLHPFIENGKLNAKIIVGDPYPHGKYDHGGLDAYHVSNLAHFLGKYLDKLDLPICSIDTKISKDDLKNNLIVIGGPVGNSITYDLNQHLPIYFDEQSGWNLVSKATGKKYNDDLAGIIIKMENPFDKDKKILVLAGGRTRGTLAAVMAFTKHIEDIFKANSDIVSVIVHGIDSDGDGLPDDAKIVE